MLDVRRLLVLRAVAENRSLRAAADSLNYTPSAISQQIAALEREVGMPLLERGARGVALTYAGQVLVEHARQVFERLDAAEAELADLAALRHGRLRIASFATAGATVVPWAVDRFRAGNPDVEVLVEQATSTEGIVRLRRGELDVVLTVDQDQPTGVEVTKLFDDPFRVALHRDHPHAHDPDLTLADLAAERWIDVPRHTAGGGVLPRVLGPQVRVAHASDDYAAIHELVGAGLGVALLPTLALLPANPAVVIRDLGPDAPRRRIQAATRPDNGRTTIAAPMLAILRTYRPRPVDQAGAVSTPSRYVGT